MAGKGNQQDKEGQALCAGRHCCWSSRRVRGEGAREVRREAEGGGWDGALQSGAGDEGAWLCGEGAGEKTG